MFSHNVGAAVMMTMARIAHSPSSSPTTTTTSIQAQQLKNTCVIIDRSGRACIYTHISSPDGERKLSQQAYMYVASSDATRRQKTDEGAPSHSASKCRKGRHERKSGQLVCRPFFPSSSFFLLRQIPHICFRANKRQCQGTSSSSTATNQAPQLT